MISKNPVWSSRAKAGLGAAEVIGYPRLKTRQEALMTNSTSTYILLLPSGEEGPYTREELCGLLRRGKARADDHLREAPSGTPTRIAAVIPEAAELMKSAPPISERVRRKTSDRQKAVIDAQASTQGPDHDHPSAQAQTLVDLKSPDQGPAPSIVQAVKDRLRRTSESIAVAASDVATEIAVAAPAGGRWRVVKIIVSLVAIPLSLWWIWCLLHPTYHKAYPLSGMAWSAQVSSREQPVADVRLLIRDEQLQITWGDKTSLHAMTMESGNAGLTFHLVPAHPEIGERALLERGGTSARHCQIPWNLAMPG
jgi:hypothetical protein